MSEPEPIREPLQELVLLLDDTGNAVRREMHYADFERLVRREWAMPQLADAIIRAAYVQVGAGLRVRGLACFTFTLDEDGRILPGFNIPLPYLVAHAGIRNDLDIGAIRVASRSQCPVPWFSVKLWEPVPGPDGSGRLIQRAVMLNRMGLRSLPPHAEVAAEAANGTKVTGTPAAGGTAKPVSDAPATGGPRAAKPAPAARQLLEERVALQREYLEQIRGFRAEIRELKAALRHEQERNRRLQALVRGEL